VALFGALNVRTYGFGQLAQLGKRLSSPIDSVTHV